MAESLEDERGSYRRALENMADEWNSSPEEKQQFVERMMNGQVGALGEMRLEGVKSPNRNLAQRIRDIFRRSR